MKTKTMQVEYPEWKQPLGVSYAISGKGQPTVFLNGFLGNMEYWSNYFGHAKTNRLEFACLAFDYINHRQTRGNVECNIENNVKLMRGLLRQSKLDYQEPILVCHSLGSYVGLYYANEYPTKGIVAIDSIFDPNMNSFLSDYVKLGIKKIPESVLKNAGREFFIGFNDEQIEPYVKMAMEIDDNAKFEIATSAVKHREEIFNMIAKRELESELIYIMPEHGIGVGQDEMFRKYEVEVIKTKGGHCVQITNPNTFNKTLTDVLMTLSTL